MASIEELVQRIDGRLQELRREIASLEEARSSIDATNPGQWMTHCHNLYHASQGGMMATLSYQT